MLLKLLINIYFYYSNDCLRNKHCVLLLHGTGNTSIESII